MHVYYVSPKARQGYIQLCCLFWRWCWFTSPPPEPLFEYSCSFTHLVAHALHLGAIEVSLCLRAAHLEVVLALRLRLQRRGSIASTRRSGPPRRRGRASPRHPPRAARRRPRSPAAARRREGEARARRERATRREAVGNALSPSRRRRVVPETSRREPPRTTPPWTRACDRRARMTRRTRRTRRGGSSLAPAARGGSPPWGRARGAVARSSLSRSVRRESMQRRRRGWG